MINYKEIFEAWKISLNPTSIQSELASKRLDICLGCEYRKEVLDGIKWSALCTDCGCPINKKIFSTMFNPCTKKKWEYIDSMYLDKPKNKTDNSLI